MDHLVLLGDSIFDNAAYVTGQQAVIDHLRRGLSDNVSVTLLAVDGDVTSAVGRQLDALPADATHLFVSVGGNDALQNSHLLTSTHNVVAELTRVYLTFATNYGHMLDRVLDQALPTAVCTIYDSVPGIEDSAVMALSLFNDVILRFSFERCLPVIDLRLLCNQPSDYASLSPIEPSSQGGAKIASAIRQLHARHDFLGNQSAIYPRLPPPDLG